MQKKNRLQTALTSWISLSMVFGLSGLNLMAESVKAASADLLISEVNVLGSSTDSTDDWIEVYNPGNTDIIFGAPNTYEVYENAGLASEKKIAVLNSGSIKKNSYLLISKYATSASTLNIPADLSFDATVNELSNTGAEYSIKKNGTTIIDTLNTAPFLEQSACADKDMADRCIIASVTRTNEITDVSKSIGYNFDTTIQQLGTPANQADSFSQLNGYNNFPVIGDATITGISPISPTYLDTPTISGQKGAANASITLKITNQAAPTTNIEVIDVRNDPAFSRAFTAASVAGSYAISTFSSDALGNRSVERSLVKNYTINKLVTTVEATPLYTNKTNVVVKGMTTPGAMFQIENTTTGVIPPAYALVNTDGSFSATVDLQVDTANSLIVRTKIGSLNFADPISITVNQDSTLPADLIKEKTVLNIGTPGNSDSTKGLAGAYTPYEANIKVEAYADALLTKLIGSSFVNTDGSFNTIDLGDNKYAAIYLVATDLAGNKSANALILENPINFVNSSLVINGQIGTISQDSAKISWDKVPGAVSYRLKYKAFGATYSNPMDVCLVGSCNFDSTIIGLTPNTDYTFAIAAVDVNGNESAYTEYSFRTLAVIPAVTIEETASTESENATTPTSVATENTTTEILPTASPTPEPSNEEGDVKSTSETNEGRNWTPWIILGILAGLAVLATSGYFYWFGGEAGEIAMESVTKNSGSTEVKKEEDALKSNKKDKRW